jgi:HlyD family secretion protein
MKKIFKALYQRKWVFWPLLIIILFIGYKAVKGGAQITEELITVTRGDITETVIATGSVKPKNAASLRFESAGTISKLNVAVGDKVVQGQLLATLNAGDLRQGVIQAEAELSAAQVALANAGQGLSDTGTKNEQALSSAYANALAGLGDILNLAQTTHDTVKSVFDQASISNKAESLERLDDSYDIILLSLKKLTPVSTRSEIETALQKVYAPLLVMQQVTIALIRELNSFTSNDENDAYRTLATGAQADINEAVANVAAYSKAIKDASTDGVLDENTSSASYRTAQAQVETARAAVSIARANLANASLYAPMNGVIASKSKSIGEGVTATDQIYYILGEGGLEVSANIPEVDIAKVAVGNPATVILDAYGEEVPFEVTVTQIDPAETVIDGVATYKTTFTFNTADERVRSGMTANIVVATQKREGVLVIPFRATTVKDGQRVVLVVRGEERVDVPVKLGLRGNNGDVEVVSGLSEGDTLVIEKK